MSLETLISHRGDCKEDNIHDVPSPRFIQYVPIQALSSCVQIESVLRNSKPAVRVPVLSALIASCLPSMGRAISLIHSY